MSRYSVWAMTLAMCALLSSACCHGRANGPPVSRVEWVPRPCMESEPPSPPHVEFLDPCPTELCMDATNATALYLYLGRLQRWAEKAWTLCGPEAVSDTVNEGAEAPEGEPL